MPRMSYSQSDFSGEKTVMSVEIPAFDAATFDAKNTLVVNLAGAITGVCIGEKVKHEISLDTLNGSATGNASDSEAQRELKWLVQYHDAGIPTRKLTTELGCPDVIDDTLLIAGTDLADLADTGGKWAAFITAFEALVLAPYTGNAVVVDRITLVGRRS